MKKSISLLLCAALSFSLLTGCAPKSNSSSSSLSESGSTPHSSSSSAPDLPDFMVLAGPTGVGAAKLITDYKAGVGDAVIASATVAAENKEVTDALVSGRVDVAAVATNVAANLSSKTDGAIQVLAVNTLGVLYILEKGDSISSMADLAGKTVYATGQGANPEFILSHLLQENGVDPSKVDIQWMTAQEVSAKMASSESAICMLPVPAATALMIQDSGVRQALSLSDEWDMLGDGALAQGCIVARTQYIEENPQGVENFLDAYAQSIAYMKDENNRDEAAQLVAQCEITPNAKVALQAIPQCNLTYIAGNEMQDMLESYYQVLYQFDAASIGGAMPYDSFYYGVS